LLKKPINSGRKHWKSGFGSDWSIPDLTPVAHRCWYQSESIKRPHLKVSRVASRSQELANDRQISA
jgi:hypothetical protein